MFDKVEQESRLWLGRGSDWPRPIGRNSCLGPNPTDELGAKPLGNASSGPLGPIGARRAARWQTAFESVEHLRCLGPDTPRAVESQRPRSVNADPRAMNADPRALNGEPVGNRRGFLGSGR